MTKTLITTLAEVETMYRAALARDEAAHGQDPHARKLVAYLRGYLQTTKRPDLFTLAGVAAKLDKNITDEEASYWLGAQDALQNKAIAQSMRSGGQHV